MKRLEIRITAHLSGVISIFDKWFGIFCALQNNEKRERIQERALTHCRGRVTHICVSKLNTIGSDNGLSPGRRQAIIGINAGILLIGPLGTNFSEDLIEI